MADDGKWLMVVGWPVCLLSCLSVVVVLAVSCLIYISNELSGISGCLSMYWLAG